MDANSVNLLSAPSALATPRRPAPRFEARRSGRGSWCQIGSITSFDWTQVSVQIHDLPQALHGLRILHLSDLHLRPRWCGGYERLFSQMRADVPDLIVFSGDFVEHRHDFRKTLPTAERFARQLHARLGVFAILGNHDGDLLGPRLRDWGIELLDGRMARLSCDHAAIEIVGVPSVSRRDLSEKFLRSIPPLEAHVARLVLAHFPDSIRKLRHVDAHLVLTGHTHGGQVCLPGGFPIITHDALPRSMCKGIHAVDDKLLVINRGLGFASVSMRLFCPAEVVEISLTPPRVR